MSNIDNSCSAKTMSLSVTAPAGAKCGLSVPCAFKTKFGVNHAKVVFLHLPHAQAGMASEHAAPHS